MRKTIRRITDNKLFFVFETNKRYKKQQKETNTIGTPIKNINKENKKQHNETNL